MSEADSPTSGEMLKSLRLLRSADPAERQRGIAGLSKITDDPRVLQVFEYLYEKDPDPGVREAVWRTLSRQGPSVPAPAPTPQRAAIASRSKPAAPRTTFLVNPANRARVRRLLHEGPAPARRGSRALGLLVGLLLLATGFLAGLAAPAWADWYRLREDGVRTEATITGLSAPLDPADEGPYSAAYRFQVSGVASSEDDPAPVFFGEQRLSANLHLALAEDRPITVPVVYLPRDPTVSRMDIDSPDDTRRERLAILAAGAAAIALLVGLVNWIMGLPSRGALRGKMLRGQVVSAEMMRSKDGGRQISVRFRFRSPGGRVITSETTRPAKSVALPEAGTPVLIEYQSDRRFHLL